MGDRADPCGSPFDCTTKSDEISFNLTLVSFVVKKCLRRPKKLPSIP